MLYCGHQSKVRGVRLPKSGARIYPTAHTKKTANWPSFVRFFGDFGSLDEIRQRLPDLPVEEVEQDVAEAIAAVRGMS